MYNVSASAGCVELVELLQNQPTSHEILNAVETASKPEQAPSPESTPSCLSNQISLASIFRPPQALPVILLDFVNFNTRDFSKGEQALLELQRRARRSDVRDLWVWVQGSVGFTSS